MMTADKGCLDNYGKALESSCWHLQKSAVFKEHVSIQTKKQANTSAH